MAVFSCPDPGFWKLDQSLIVYLDCDDIVLE
jgi:hypothetical protein